MLCARRAFNHRRRVKRQPGAAGRASCARSDTVDNRQSEARDEDELPDVETATETAPDALDFYGFWKLFDALTDAAFHGRNREYALGNTPQQRYMGAWSDGRPVTELVVLNRCC